MTTSKQFIEFSDNRLIELEDLDDRFFDHLSEKSTALGSAVYDLPGVLGELGLSYTAGQLTITGSASAVDGLGNFLLPSSELAYCDAVPFQDAAGVTYEVTIHRVTAPLFDPSGGTNTMRGNADTGQAEYVANVELIGEKGEPDSVALVGDDIVLIVDGLCEAGVTHAGRKALVYLNVPMSELSSIGLALVDVEFSGGQNRVIVEDNKLGQSGVSLSAEDYTVVILGPTIRRNSSKVGELGYVLIGSMTDGEDDTSEQVHFGVTLANLNQAFNSFAENQAIAAVGGTKAPPPTSTYGAASVTNGASLLVFGGILSATTEATLLSSILEYDTESDAWTTKGTVMPDAFTAHMAAARVGDIVYIAGGHNGAAVTNRLLRYDVETDTFLDNGAPMPAARHGGALVAFGDDLFYVAGDTTTPDVDYLAQSNVYKYSIATDAWSEVAGLDTIGLAMSRCDGVAAGNKIYVPGGWGSPQAMAIYTPALDVWELGAPRQQTLGPYFKYGTFELNGVIHVLAGQLSNNPTNNGAIAHHHAYSIAGDRWATMPVSDMAGVYGAAVGVFDGVCYIAGGRGGSGPVLWTSTVNLAGVRSATADGAAIEVGSTPSSNPEAFAVESLPDLAISRVGASVCSLGSGFLITGGRNWPNDTALAHAELYWPRTRTQMLCAEMPAADRRMYHGSVEHGGRALIFSGLNDIGFGTRIKSILSYNPESNDWSTLVADASGPDRHSYAIAKNGDQVYLIGGVVGGVAVNTIDSWQLSTLKAVGSGGLTGLDAAGNSRIHGCAIFVGDVLYITIDDTPGIGPTKLRALSLRNMSPDSVAPARDLDYDTMPGSVYYGGLVEWNGDLFVYAPNDREIYRINPRIHTVETIADADDGVPEVYHPNMQIQDGKLYLFGGSTLSALSDYTDKVYAMTLPSVKLASGGTGPSNFTTGKGGDAAGFRTGDVFGFMTWNPELSCDYIRMNAEL